MNAYQPTTFFILLIISYHLAINPSQLQSSSVRDTNTSYIAKVTNQYSRLSRTNRPCKTISQLAINYIILPPLRLWMRLTSRNSFGIRQSLSSHKHDLHPLIPNQIKNQMIKPIPYQEIT